MPVHVGNIDIPAKLLRIGAITVVFYCLSTVTNSILQGLNHMSTPVKHGAISLGVHLIAVLIMLIGLLSKTAILITEFAGENRAKGMSLARATYVAAKERFRPILMTVLTMVIGMIPLMFSTGVGANGNTTIGTGIVGGMVIGTLALLVVLPSLFIIFQWLQEKIKPIKTIENE